MGLKKETSVLSVSFFSNRPMFALKSKRKDIFASESRRWSAHLRVRLRQATITLPRIQIYFGDALDISKIFYKLG